VKRREILSAGAVALLAPGFARAASLRAFGGELVAALLESPPATLDRGNPRTLDPFLARTRLERELSAALHLPIIGASSHGKPHGPLVETASMSGRTWTFTLRRNLAFADGSPILASEAAASLKRLPAGLDALLDAESIDASGPLTFAITTRKPSPSLPTLLSAMGAPLVVATTPGDAFFGPIGCGAFMPGAPGGGRPSGDIVFAANVRSPAGRSYLDRLVLTALPEPAALATAIRKGQIAIAMATSTAAQVSGAGLVTADAPATIVLAIRSTLPAALRARIAACPNRKQTAAVFLKERVKPASTLLPPSLLGPLAGVDVPDVPAPFAGAKTRLSLLVGNTSHEMREIAERMVWDLQGAGVTATIGWRHPADLETEIAKARWDLLLFEWSPVVADAGWALAAEQGLLRTSATPELVADDVDVRTRAAKIADDTLRASGSLVPIVHPVRLLRVAPRIAGVTPDARGQVTWANVSVERGPP